MACVTTLKIIAQTGQNAREASGRCSVKSEAVGFDCDHDDFLYRPELKADPILFRYSLSNISKHCLERF